MGQVKDRQNKREAKKAKRKLNHKAHVKASNIESNKPGKVKSPGGAGTRGYRQSGLRG